MILDLSAYQRALKSLHETIEVLEDQTFASGLSKTQKNALRAGIIQNFEFTYELSWKFIKHWLENNIGAVYVDGVTRRQLYRIAAENHLIEDVDQWMQYHKYRNLTAHTYDEKIAREVCSIALEFQVHADLLLKALEARNA